MHDLVVVNMANAVREVSVGKGHDPRDFLFLAYGGTLPLFASQIAERLGISTIVIPQNSSVFCALGVLSSDFVVRSDQGVGWDLSQARRSRARQRGRASRWSPQALAEMQAEGFAEDQIEVQRSGRLPLPGQIYELTMPLPDRPLTAEDAPALAERVLQPVRATYGEGTAWKGVPAVADQLHASPSIGRQRADLRVHVRGAAAGGARRPEEDASGRCSCP